MFQWPIQLRPSHGGGDAVCFSFLTDNHTGTLIPAGVNHAVCCYFPASLRSVGPGT
ncbi:hypothetical protein StoSoilB22_27730 [Arthrobacter sp. StoSoilB22]|nr:hypothetical protein StoSoilB22_27730 [Arthrobacter sp. StoSoilB22]